MLMPLASHSVRIATTGSPAPRKIALATNSRMMLASPPSITRVKFVPTAITSASAPMSARSRGANTTPSAPSTTAITTASSTA
jgi:hypothetical protein